ncbi:replication initiation protein [Piscirickettsia litoralis]|uniref:Primase C-terminal 1 domain-containing protein n=1 Tax=Piscirickettsia litoralis TaxID=1891921 RepID=A0ABX2ZZS9_9GAMM|nr:replication initiation protein [Piscirickettsia litoralis]ODN41527.1 hypothetical protein BGC07_15580 [Piscirickettsia litoralis]
MLPKERVLETFKSSLPKKPYCSYKLSEGLSIWPAELALKTNYIQPNSPMSIHWMVIDIDRPESALLYEKLNLPTPNIIVINKTNGHSHYYYKVDEVYTSKNASIKAQRYYEAVKKAYVKALDADPAYTGLIAKNPVSDQWLTLYLTAHEYQLGELASHVKLESLFIPKSRKIRDEDGRNVQLFDTLRFWAYANKKKLSIGRGFLCWLFGQSKRD